MTCRFSNPNLRYHTYSHTHLPMVKAGVILLCAKRPILSRFSDSFLNYEGRPAASRFIKNVQSARGVNVTMLSSNIPKNPLFQRPL
jgi:hypothetical protein